MSEALIDWLNTYVKLSSKITSIESDFANGFFFAELLSKFQQIPNYSDYENKSDKHSITKNYIHLTKALSDLEIYLSETKKHEIIENKPGIAAQILFKIKQQLAKKFVNFETLKAKTSQEISKMYKQIEFSNENEKYYNDYIINKDLNKGKIKLDPIQKLVSKDDLYTKTIIKNIKKDEEYLKKEHMKNKAGILLFETKKAKTMREMDQNELSQWKGQMVKKKELEMKMHNEKWEETMHLIKETLKSFQDSNNIEIDSIKDFDETLARLGLDIAKIDNASADNNTKAKFISSEIIMNRIKEKVALEEKSRKDKKKRARKLKNEQMKILEKTTRDKLESQKQKEILQMIQAKDIEEREYETKRKSNYEQYENLKHFHLKEVINLGNNDENSKEEYDINAPYVSIVGVFNENHFFDLLNKETLNSKLSQINAKREKRERYVNSIKSITDMLIDIAEKAHEYQKGNKIELISIPDWGYWMNLFIENNEELHSVMTQNEQITIMQKEITQSSYHGLSQEMITYSNEELFDYINYIGQWKPRPLPQTVKRIMNRKIPQLPFYEVLGNDISYLLAAGKYPIQGIQINVLKAMKNQAFEPKREDEENAEIPQSNCFNPVIGEIVQLSLELKYSSPNYQTIHSEAKQESELTCFDYIPIKLCFIGHLFAGRKTQANKIAEMFPKIKIYCIDTILKQLIDTFEHLAAPIENHPKYKTMKKNQIEQMQKEKQIEEEKFSKYKGMLSPFVKDGDDTLINRESITDCAIIDIIIDTIKEDFPLKTKEELNAEIVQRNKRKEEILSELEKIREEQAKKAKVKVKEEQSLNNEYIQLANDSYSGFIIIDYPKTQEQFVLFEKKTKGNMQEIDQEPTELFNKQIELTKAIDRPYHSLVSKGKMKSFFDGYCLFDVNEKEAMRRFKGTRIDPNTGVVYHLEDNPPPENDKKLNERLEMLKDPSEDNVISNKQQFNLTSKKIVSYINIFNNVNKITQETKKIGEIALDIKENILLKIVNRFEKIDDESITNQQMLTGAVNNSNNNNINAINPEVLKAQFIKRLTDCKRRLPAELGVIYIAEWSSFNESYLDILQKIFIDIIEQKKKVITEMSLIQDSFISFLNTPSHKKELINIFCQKYSSFIENYHHLQKSFIVKIEFQTDLNKLTDRLWEMINQRKLSAITERERIISTGFIEEQMNAFYINIEQLFVNETEKYLRSFCLIRNFYFSIDQNRISSSFGEKPPFSMSIKPTHILNNIPAYDIISSNAKTKKVSSPRIERIYLNCVKLLFEFDSAIRELEKTMRTALAMNVSELSAISHKKRIKMNTINKDIKLVDTSQLNEEKEPFQIDEEVKNAIRKEKEKYKYRIGMLRDFGVSFLENIQRIANETYCILDEWIIDSVHYQNYAMNNLISHLRNIVDKAIPLKWNFELDIFNVYSPITQSFEERQETYPNVSNITINTNKMNQANPEEMRINLQANEKDKEKLLKQYDTNAFIKLYHLIKSYEIQQGYIIQEDLVSILIKKSLIEDNTKGLSKLFKDLSYHNYSRLINKYVFGSNKVICIKSLMAVIALIHFDIISKDRINSMDSEVNQSLVNNNELSKSDYDKLELWFEDYSDNNNDGEVNATPNVPSVMTIKDVLFEIFKDSHDMLDYQMFKDAIGLKTMNSNSLINIDQYSKYFDLLILD